MPLVFACPHCRTRYELPDQQRGRQIKCLRCQRMIVAPGGPAPAAPRPQARPTAPRAAVPGRPTYPRAPSPVRRGPAPRPAPRRKRGRLVVLALFLIIGAAGAGYAWFSGLGSSPATGPAPELQVAQATASAPNGPATEKQSAEPPQQPPAPAAAEALKAIEGREK